MLVLQWLTFVSATVAAAFQGRRGLQGWLYDRRDHWERRRIERAGWSQTGVDTWVVRLADPHLSDRAATVTIAVCDRSGKPSPNQADRASPVLGGARRAQPEPDAGRAGGVGRGRPGSRWPGVEPSPASALAGLVAGPTMKSGPGGITNPSGHPAGQAEGRYRVPSPGRHHL